MQVKLHKNSTTTPRIRAVIQASDLSATKLAKQFGVTTPTILRWKRCSAGSRRWAGSGRPNTRAWRSWRSRPCHLRGLQPYAPAEPDEAEGQAEGLGAGIGTTPSAAGLVAGIRLQDPGLQGLAALNTGHGSLQASNHSNSGANPRGHRGLLTSLLSTNRFSL